MGKSLDELASYMLPIATALIAKAQDAGLDPVVEDTGRSHDEQTIKVSTGVSWTNNSKHLPQPPENKSEAIDVVPRVCMSLKYWGWNGTIENSHPAWGELITIGEGLGLHCGVHFPHPDPGHFQYVHQEPQILTDPELSTT
jgi:hypothetical protein